MEPVDTTGWQAAFHGTWFYALWSILRSGVLAPSHDLALGHMCHHEAVYSTADPMVACHYARPSVLVSGQEIFYRVIIAVRADLRRQIEKGFYASRKKEQQWAMPSDALVVTGFWVLPNSPVAIGEKRCSPWKPHLEALPLRTESFQYVLYRGAAETRLGFIAYFSPVCGLGFRVTEIREEELLEKKNTR